MSTSRYLGRDSSRRQMEIAENSRIYPSTANEKRREKKKREKKKRGEDSTRPMNCTRERISRAN